ncbi:MAG: GtrA family protein, partial [Bacteroidales bacterium]|nr:GtrA family protein [Bacteroidales bacterium]
MIDRLVIIKFIKFCIIGTSGMVIDFGVTWLLKEKANFNKYVESSIGFFLAATSNYIWNRLWTFQSANNNITVEYLSFFGVAIFGLLLTNLIIFLLHGKWDKNFYWSKFFA